MLRSSIRILSVTALLGSVAAGTVILTGRSAEPADGAIPTLAAAPGPASALLVESADRHAAAVLTQRQSTVRAQQKAAAAKRVVAERKKAVLARVAAAARAQARSDELARASRNAARDPRAAARLMLAEYGWSSSQFSCLDRLWQRESGWNHRAENSSSGAYGIPQSLPGRKMATAGSDWRSNPLTQIEWGLGYIDDRFGTPCGAWAHSQSHGWY